MSSKYVITDKDIARFWSKVPAREPGTCWKWGASHNKGGYGQMGLKWTDGKFHMTAVHRLSWVLAYGPIPEGRWILHRCDIRNCVNPNHYFLGDAASNVADRVAKQRSNQKLTAEQVLVILSRLSTGERGRDLAKEYGVSEQLICDYKHGRSRPSICPS